MMKRLPIPLLVLLTTLLLFLGSAAAGEALDIATVEMYSAGSFAAPIAMPRTYAAQTFEEVMTEYLSSMSTAVLDLSAFELDFRAEFTPMYQALLNKHPEWFYLSNSIGIKTTEKDASGNSIGQILKFQAIYKYTADEMPYWNAVYQSGVNAVADYAAEADTDVGRILRANDYLCANYKYDTRIDNASESIRDQTVYSPELFFEQGTGVCQAYMLAFDAVMSELGIDCEAVTSDAMNHTWNLVKVNGSWYHVDVTWNDALSNKMDIPYRVLHTNLLLSDDALAEEDHHDWNALSSATSSTYDDYFWQKLNQAAPMLGDVVYYVDDSTSVLTPKLCSFNLKTNTRTQLFIYRSYSSDFSDTFYRNSHPIWVAKNLIFYARDNMLVAAQPDGTKPVKVSSISDASKRIYHLYESAGRLYMHIGSKPSSVGSISSIAMFDSLLAMPVTVDAEVNDRIKLYSSVSLGDSITWTSSDTDVATVSTSGLVEMNRVGAVTIHASGTDGSAVSTIIAHSKSPFILPASLETIEANAFAGLPVEEVVLPDTVESIGANAFVGCEGLYLLNLPECENGLDIDPTAFADCDNLTLLCSSDEAEAAAETLGIPTIRLP